MALLGPIGVSGHTCLVRRYVMKVGSFVRVSVLGAVAGITALVAGVVAPVGAAGGGLTVSEVFERRGPDEVSPSGNSVYADCQDGDGAPEGWLDATASLQIKQADGSSRITIRVRDAKPGAYYTVWLRLGGTDSEGDTFGRNPVTGGRATPLAATGDLPDLLASTGSGNGNDDQPNGFRTDARGHAVFRTVVDFPILAGAYPFQRFADWDPTDERLPIDDAAIYPVAIAGPQGPYTLRIVSHCTDDVGHGLQSGPREWWFDWTVRE